MTGDRNFRSVAAFVNKLAFPIPLCAKFFLDRLEGGGKHRFEKSMRSHAQRVLRFPSVQFLSASTPVPYRAIKIADHDRVFRENDVFLSCRHGRQLTVSSHFHLLGDRSGKCLPYHPMSLNGPMCVVREEDQT